MQPEITPVQQSLLTWVFHALGLEYAILLPLVGLLSFVLALIIVARGRGPMAVAALVLIVHVPMLIGLFAAIQGAASAYTVIATSAITPRPSDVAVGVSTALVAPMVGMLLMVPGYLVAALGSLVRSFLAKADRTERAA